MPKDFNFIYSYNDWDEINTFDSTFTRKGIKTSNDYLQDTVIKLILTTSEKEAIYRVMMENKVLEMPKEFECDPKSVQVSDASSEWLTVQIYDTVKRITLYHGCGAYKSVLSNNFMKIVNYIHDSIFSKKVVNSLPKCQLFLP